MDRDAKLIERCARENNESSSLDKGLRIRVWRRAKYIYISIQYAWCLTVAPKSSSAVRERTSIAAAARSRYDTGGEGVRSEESGGRQMF